MVMIMMMIVTDWNRRLSASPSPRNYIRYVCMFISLSRQYIFYRTHPFCLRKTIAVLGSQGRHAETREKRSAQIVLQFCVAVTKNLFLWNYLLGDWESLLPEIRAKTNDYKFSASVETMPQCIRCDESSSFVVLRRNVSGILAVHPRFRSRSGHRLPSMMIFVFSSVSLGACWDIAYVDVVQDAFFQVILLSTTMKSFDVSVSELLSLLKSNRL